MALQPASVFRVLADFYQLDLLPPEERISAALEKRAKQDGSAAVPRQAPFDRHAPCVAPDLLSQRSCPGIYFKLVANFGVHDLEHETAAQIAAIELARSIRQDKPELVGHGYSVSVTDEVGADVCRIPIEIP
jgi:hypothetical protein